MRVLLPFKFKGQRKYFLVVNVYNSMRTNEMTNFLILVVMVIIHRSLADVGSDGVIMPTKCEGKIRDIAILIFGYSLHDLQPYVSLYYHVIFLTFIYLAFLFIDSDTDSFSH